MTNENIELLSKGIEKLKASAKETNELIAKLEEAKKKEEARLSRNKPKVDSDTINDFFKFTNTILDQIERDMLRSPFHAKIRLADEEEAARMTKDIFGKGKKQQKKNDKVEHPEHYQGKTECIDAMEKEFGKTAVEWFCLLNAFKYEYRKDAKGNRDEDMKKRDWYIGKFNELRSSENKKAVFVRSIEDLVKKYR